MSPDGNQTVLASLLTSANCSVPAVPRLKVPWALKYIVVGNALAGTLVAEIGEHIGVGVGVGVGLTDDVVVGSGEGVPAQIATVMRDSGLGVAELLEPPLPQLEISATATNDMTGTTTRHLRNQSIEH